MYGLYQIMYFTLIDIKNAVCSPFFIAINVLIFFQYHQIARSSNGSRFYAIKHTLSTSLLGMFGGFLATIIFIYLEVKIIPLDFIYILLSAIILSLKDTRFMCLSYGGSIITILSLTIGYPRINTRDVMQVVGVLHLIESFLILINGIRGKTVAFFPIKENVVGGFNINRFWGIPFVIFIGDSIIRPITLMAILNYSDFTYGLPHRKAILTSITLFIYSMIILLLINNGIDLILVALYTIIFHEIIIHGNKKFEEMRKPKFPIPKNGVRVLSVKKGSIAKKVGIKPGDVIFSINDGIIRNEEDLSIIENFNNSYIKIVYYSENKGKRTKIYKGRNRKLGVNIISI